MSADPQIENIFNYVKLAIGLIEDGKPDRAKNALEKIMPQLCRLTLELTDAPTNSTFVNNVVRTFYEYLDNPMAKKEE